MPFISLSEYRTKTIYNRLSKFAGFALCLLSAPIGVVASKGAVPLIAITGLLGSLALIAERRPVIFRLVLPVGIIATLLIWAAASSIWAIETDRAVFLVIRIVAICLAGFALLLVLTKTSSAIRRVQELLILYGYGLGIAFLAIGYAYASLTTEALWGSYYFDPLTTLNNGANTMTLMAWPVLAILWRQQHYKIMAALISGIAVSLLFLSSGAALLALFSGLTTFAIVLKFGRRAGLTIGVILAILVISTPSIVKTLLNPETVKSFASEFPPSVKHRVLMWQFANDRINEKPILGWGMDASRDLPQEEFRLSPNMQIMPLHPHNAFLQIRLELGWPGIVMTAVLLLSIFWAFLPPNAARSIGAIRVGGATSYISICAVSYGVWQNWWIATAWILATLIAIATAHEGRPDEVVEKEYT